MISKGFRVQGLAKAMALFDIITGTLLPSHHTTLLPSLPNTLLLILYHFSFLFYNCNGAIFFWSTKKNEKKTAPSPWRKCAKSLLAWRRAKRYFFFLPAPSPWRKCAKRSLAWNRATRYFTTHPFLHFTTNALLILSYFTNNTCARARGQGGRSDGLKQKKFNPTNFDTRNNKNNKNSLIILIMIQIILIILPLLLLLLIK